MNKQIKLLAEQSAENSRFELAFPAITVGEGDTKMTIPCVFVEKFAELIIRECIVTLQDQMGRGKRDDYYRGQSDSIRLLQQHFGVEP
jgi:hypothetical protein